MISKIKITNFKCFNDFVLDKLALINLVGGRNNSGKSALLEALFIAFGFKNPQIFYALSALRSGNGPLNVTPQKMWGHLFYNFTECDSFSIVLNRTDASVSTLTMSKVPDETVGFNVNSQVVGSLLNQGYDSNDINKYFYALKFQYELKDTHISGEYRIQDNTIKYNFDGNSSLPLKKISFYNAKSQPDNVVVAEWVSKFILENRKQSLLDLLKLFDEEIVDITTVVDNSLPYVFAIRSNGQKLSINYMGDGINKALQVLLSILTSPNGILLIDEIENGFHYSLYTKLFEAFYKAALEVDCQLFITTHNAGVIKETADVMGRLEKLSQLAYHRFDFTDGKRQVFSFNGEQLSDALDVAMEVR